MDHPHLVWLELSFGSIEVYLYHDSGEGANHSFVFWIVFTPVCTLYHLTLVERLAILNPFGFLRR